jgi:hypothetical protein
MLTRMSIGSLKKSQESFLSKNKLLWNKMVMDKRAVMKYKMASTTFSRI